MTVWIGISLLLHLFTILALLIAYKKLALLERSHYETGFEEGSSPPLSQKLEEYIQQLEQENGAFFQKVADHLRKREADWQKREAEWSARFDALEQDLSFLRWTTPYLTQKNPVFHQVLELHKAGYTPEEIGKQLNIGVGEVSLLIRLFEKDC